MYATRPSPSARYSALLRSRQSPRATCRSTSPGRLPIPFDHRDGRLWHGGQGDRLAESYAMVRVSVLAADSDAEGRRLFTTSQQKVEDNFLRTVPLTEGRVRRALFGA